MWVNKWYLKNIKFIETTCSLLFWSDMILTKFLTETQVNIMLSACSESNFQQKWIMILYISIEYLHVCDVNIFLRFGLVSSGNWCLHGARNASHIPSTCCRCCIWETAVVHDAKMYIKWCWLILKKTKVTLIKYWGRTIDIFFKQIFINSSGSFFSFSSVYYKTLL